MSAEGDLIQFIDRVCSRNNWSWKIERDVDGKYYTEVNLGSFYNELGIEIGYPSLEAALLAGIRLCGEDE